MGAKLEADSKSQAGQESFVLHCLGRKRGGWFLEIGAFHSTDLSNTYILETRYDWSGIAVELDEARALEYASKRRAMCHVGNACFVDYRSLLGNANAPDQIDYLQVDIEPARQSLKALKAVLSSGYRFSVVTFEHDLYASRGNWFVRARSRLALRRAGYMLVAADVSNGGNPFEDWWVDPAAVLPQALEPFQHKGSDWNDFYK